MSPSLPAEWRGTANTVSGCDVRTARGMGPGVMGQLVNLIPSDPATALDCQRCHSPLSEQQEKVRRERNG